MGDFIKYPLATEFTENADENQGVQFKTWLSVMVDYVSIQSLCFSLRTLRLCANNCGF